ncbi:MAG: diacylglycerol/polyprenol kinase family protein [Candidatus Kariarchaeaceae archaeon]
MDLFVEPTTNDLIFLVVALVGTASVVVLGELLEKKTSMSANGTRKLIHITVGNIILFTPWLFDNRIYATLPPAIFIIINYLTCPISPIEKLRLKAYQSGNSLGTVYYPIALTLITFIFFEQPIIMNAAFLPLVWGDGFAAVIGQKYGSSNSYTIMGNKKSLIGSLAFYLASSFGIAIGFLFIKLTDLEEFTLFGVVCFIVALTTTLTIVEIITPKNLDNLSIVFVGAIISSCFYFFDVHLLEETNLTTIVVGILFFLRVITVLAMIYFVFKFEKLRGYFKKGNDTKIKKEELETNEE